MSRKPGPLTEKERIAQRTWREKNRATYLPRQRRWRQALKFEILSHYGKNGAAQCCWESCKVNDLDMLTLDHVNDDGAVHRNYPRRGPRNGLHAKLGVNFYSDLKQHGFPEGYQTLCANHQLKKEILRQQAAKTA